MYEVGTGCEVAELIPGIDLLSEAFRSNGRSVVAALRWITEELARARYLITVGCYYSKHSISRSPLQKREEVWGESYLAGVCGIVTLDCVVSHLVFSPVTVPQASFPRFLLVSKWRIELLRQFALIRRKVESIVKCPVFKGCPV